MAVRVRRFAHTPPEHQNTHQRQSQQADFLRGNGENVTDEILIVLGKASAIEGSNKNTQGHGGAGKDTNEGIRSLVASAFYIRKQQGKSHTEDYCRPQGCCHAKNSADGNAGKGGMAQCIGKEAHPSRYHHS